jgi:hypothetical protein
LLLSRSFYVTQGAASLVLISLARLIDIYFSKEKTPKESLMSFIFNHGGNSKDDNNEGNNGGGDNKGDNEGGDKRDEYEDNNENVC